MSTEVASWRSCQRVFTSRPFGAKGMQAGELPWDLKRFRKEIEAELGEPWTCPARSRPAGGARDCQVLGEIHRAMKEASGGKPVFYYQNTGCQTLDHLERPLFKQARSLNVAPIRYAQILKPGLCDGIFGYPNKQADLGRPDPVHRGQAPLPLVQPDVVPPGMRLCKLDEMVELARWNDPGNVGSFLFPTHGRKERAWNELEYQDESSYWTSSDHVPRFAWDHKIGQPIVDRGLHRPCSSYMTFPGRARATSPMWSCKWPIPGSPPGMAGALRRRRCTALA